MKRIYPAAEHNSSRAKVELPPPAWDASYPDEQAPGVLWFLLGLIVGLALGAWGPDAVEYLLVTLLVTGG